MKPEGIPKRKWLKRLVASVLVLVLLPAAAYFLPWSPPGLRGAAERSLAKRLGCDVTIGRLTVWLSHRQVRLQNIVLDYSARGDRFASIKAGKPIWRLGEAILSASSLAGLLDRRRPVEISVALHDPDPLIVVAGKRGAELFPPLDEIRTSPSKPARWFVSTAFVNPAVVRLIWRGAKGGTGKTALLSRLQATYSAEAGGPVARYSVQGRIGAKGTLPLKAELIRRGNRWVLRAKAAPLEFAVPAPVASSPKATIGETEVFGLMQRSPAGLWDFSLNIHSGNLEIFGVEEKEPSLVLSGKIDPKTSSALAALSLSGSETRIAAAFDLALGGRKDSYTTLTIERIGAGWVRAWNEVRPPAWPVIESGPIRVSAVAEARIAPHPLRISNPRIRVAAGCAGLDSEFLPLALREIEIEASFGREKIAIHRCRGKWGHGWISLAGDHAGPWWPRLGGTTRVDARFDLRVEDLMTTVPPAAANSLTTSALARLAERPFCEGDLGGSTTLVLEWKEGEKPTPPSTVSLMGVVNLREGRLTHPLLPAPVTGIEGTFDIRSDRLRIRSVSGKMLGSTATVSATITGTPLFWIHPNLSCSVRTEFPAAEIARMAPEKFRSRLEQAKVRGTVRAEFSLLCPICKPFCPRKIASSGTMTLSDIAFRSPFWALEGEFHDLEGRVVFSNRTIRLTSATGRIEEVPFSLTGEADLEGKRIWARLESSATLAALRKVMPRALSRYEVGGSLSGWFELEASGRNLFAEAAHLRGFTSETLAALPFDWHLGGEVTAHDAELTFETFPTSLTAINGRITLDGLRWKFENLTSSWGKTDNCIIRGGGRFRPGNWPEMNIELEAPVLYLDEWIRPWRRSRGRRFKPRPENPVFEMQGTIRGKRAFYRGHPGENFHGRFTLVSPYRQTDTFRFFDTHVGLYGGRLEGRGVIEFDKGRSTNTLELVAENINLPPLLQCESGREQTFVGRLTGNGTFHWLNGDPETLTGRGRIVITESRFWGNVFFRNLARLIKIPFLDDVSFARIETPFRLSHRRVFCDRLVMEGPMLKMSGKGSVGFDHSVDFVLELGFPNLPSYAKLLDIIVQQFGRIPATVFSLDLTGTWDSPQFSFHQLDTAERNLLDALEQLWDTLNPPPAPKNPPRKPPSK